MTLNYQSTLLKTREEISMVVLGPFTNIIIFCLTVIFSWILQRLYGTSPNIFSRFIMAYGINVLLDPIWILIVDSALMRYDALCWPLLKKLLNPRFLSSLRMQSEKLPASWIYLYTLAGCKGLVRETFLWVKNKNCSQFIFYARLERSMDYVFAQEIVLKNIESPYI